jgi:5-methylcytosine-specific restriction enzyme subunit McrC
LEENAILLWALYLASRIGLKREEVKRQVRQAYRNLIGAVSFEPKIARDCTGRFYHRLNDDYKPMHGLCRFLVEQTGFGTNIGNYDFLPFSLDMPKLFEEFVAEWLNGNLSVKLRVDPQYHVQLNATADLSFRIDLVLRDRMTGQALAVIDVKYKAADKPSESDIQQVVAYAIELGVSRGHLVYPFRLSQPVQAQIGNVKISTIGIDLNRSFAENWKVLERAITTD